MAKRTYKIISIVLFLFFLSLWGWMFFFFSKKIEREKIKQKQTKITTTSLKTIFKKQIDKKEKVINKNQKKQTERMWCGNFPCLSSEEFVQIWEKFEQKLPYKKKRIPITQSKEENILVWEIAEKHGYHLRPIANEISLAEENGKKVKEEVKKNFRKLSQQIKAYGYTLSLRSAYRSPEQQKKIFLKKIQGKKLNSYTVEKILKTIAPPGYSKHHTGYAVDFTCENGDLKDFRESPCYILLSANNFELAKEYGFIPSYPFTKKRYGPLPEPWEFVWVGKKNIFNLREKDNNQ